MKKLLMLGLTLGTVATLSTAIQSNADVIDNGDGTQTVNNNDGTNNTDSADITVTGRIGFDNTDPESPEPTDPDQWIHVTLPTAAVFESKEDKSIDSPTYQIENKSGRPVKVAVSNYVVTGATSIPEIDELNFVTTNPAVAVPLIANNDVVTDFSTAGTLTLGSPSVSPQTVGPSEVEFGFGGQVSSSFTTGSYKVIDSTLTLNFTPLQADGSAY
jgi:hypothetical protein